MLHHRIAGKRSHIGRNVYNRIKLPLRKACLCTVVVIAVFAKMLVIDGYYAFTERLAHYLVNIYLAVHICVLILYVLVAHIHFRAEVYYNKARDTSQHIRKGVARKQTHRNHNGGCCGKNNDKNPVFFEILRRGVLMSVNLFYQSIHVEPQFSRYSLTSVSSSSSRSIFLIRALAFL